MKIVIIVVEGGVIQDVVCPKGGKVVVRDFDTDGLDEQDLPKDDNGNRYVENIWE